MSWKTEVVACNSPRRALHAMPLSQKVYACLVAWILCLNVRLVLAGWEQVCTSETLHEPPRGYFCGKALAQIVSTICQMQGGYYSGGYLMAKRSTNTLPEADAMGKKQLFGLGPPAKHAEQLDHTYFMPKELASSILNRDRRMVGGRGIVCECCYNRCSMRELTQYCAGSSGRKRSSVSLPKVPMRNNKRNKFAKISLKRSMVLNPQVPID